jgi:uncharacterized protein (TIGR02996 family)
MRMFVYTDEKSNKFWNIDLQGDRFTLTFGRVGSKGQTQTKDFPDAQQARKAHDKLVAEKLGKGYVETTSAAAPAPASSPLQQSLEAALVENPDDLAAHSAYADFLMEHGDPRGEFIQVQLALEDTGRPAEERKRLQRRESELLAEHAGQWLGDAGRFLVGEWSGEDKPYHFQFRRGWLDFVRTLPFPDSIVAALARSPEARLLSRLDVIYDMEYHPFDFDQFMEGPNDALRAGERENNTYEGTEILEPLLESPYLMNLRAFKFGFSDGEQLAHSTMVAPFEGSTAAEVIELLEKCPRLEWLCLNTHIQGIQQLFAHPALSNLRLLQYYYGTGYEPDGTYPLRAGGTPYRLNTLASNPALSRLTTLRLHPGREATIELDELDALLRSPNLPSLTHLQVHMTNFGDEGYRRIIDSGILRRLEVLDIGYGNMTDEGARLLADCPDLRHLKLLDVTRNGLTARGIAALRETRIQVAADNQHAPGEEDYLWEVDFE